MTPLEAEEYLQFKWLGFSYRNSWGAEGAWHLSSPNVPSMQAFPRYIFLRHRRYREPSQSPNSVETIRVTNTCQLGDPSDGVNITYNLYLQH